MKRSLLILSSFVLLSAMAFASASPNLRDIFDKKKKRRELPEFGAVSMLVLSLGTIAGGLAVKQRRERKPQSKREEKNVPLSSSFL